MQAENEEPPAVPAGFCLCGCGGKTGQAQRSSPKKGIKKGQPLHFLPNHHQKTIDYKGSNNPYWKGGSFRTTDGYMLILMQGHPRANVNGYVRQSIINAEHILGKPIPSEAVVHHYNGKNNDREIVICQDRAYHNLLHRRMRALAACGNANYLKCSYCKGYDDPSNLIETRHSSAYHVNCYNEYRREHRLAKRGNNSGLAAEADLDNTRPFGELAKELGEIFGL